MRPGPADPATGIGPAAGVLAVRALIGAAGVRAGRCAESLVGFIAVLRLVGSPTGIATGFVSTSGDKTEEDGRGDRSPPHSLRPPGRSRDCHHLSVRPPLNCGNGSRLSSLRRRSTPSTGIRISSIPGREYADDPAAARSVPHPAVWSARSFSPAPAQDRTQHG